MLDNFVVQIIVIIAICTLFVSLSNMIMGTRSPFEVLSALAAVAVIVAVFVSDATLTDEAPVPVTSTTTIEIGTAHSIVREPSR